MLYFKKVDNCDGSPSEKYPVSIDVRSQSMKMHKYLRRSSDHCAYQVTGVSKRYPSVVLCRGWFVNQTLATHLYWCCLTWNWYDKIIDARSQNIVYYIQWSICWKTRGGGVQRCIFDSFLLFFRGGVNTNNIVLIPIIYRYRTSEIVE